MKEKLDQISNVTRAELESALFRLKSLRQQRVAHTDEISRLRQQANLLLEEIPPLGVAAVAGNLSRWRQRCETEIVRHNTCLATLHVEEEIAGAEARKAFGRNEALEHLKKRLQLKGRHHSL